jgi:hypothetical protein
MGWQDQVEAIPVTRRTTSKVSKESEAVEISARL